MSGASSSGSALSEGRAGAALDYERSELPGSRAGAEEEREGVVDGRVARRGSRSSNRSEHTARYRRACFSCRGQRAAACARLLAAVARTRQDRCHHADEAPAMWPPELKKGWSVEVGEGYSSPVPGDGRVFVHARRDPDEVVSGDRSRDGHRRLDADIAAPTEKNPTRSRWPRGPTRPRSWPMDGSSRSARRQSCRRGTPPRARSSGAGLLVAIDTSKLFCGTAMSPLLTKSGISFMSATIAAADHGARPRNRQGDGRRRFAGPGYASPIEVTLGGLPQIVTMTTRSVIGVDVATGGALGVSVRRRWNENIVTPIATPDRSDRLRRA